MDHPCFEDEEYLKRLMERSNDEAIEIPSDIKNADDFYNWIHSRKSTNTEPKEKK
jgi:hypothetical protein